jgi:hypothetical protein
MVERFYLGHEANHFSRASAKRFSRLAVQTSNWLTITFVSEENRCGAAGLRPPLQHVYCTPLRRSVICAALINVV